MYSAQGISIYTSTLGMLHDGADIRLFRTERAIAGFEVVFKSAVASTTFRPQSCKSGVLSLPKGRTLIVYPRNVGIS